MIMAFFSREREEYLENIVKKIERPKVLKKILMGFSNNILKHTTTI